MLGLLGLFGAIMVGLFADSVMHATEEEGTGGEDFPEDDTEDLSARPSILDAEPEPDIPARAPAGTEDPEFLSGSAEADLLLALGGGDDLGGYAGDDGLFGGDGDDTLWGDEDADQLVGGSDEDLLNGGEGDDSLWGGEGDDLLAGQMGDDLMHGGGGADMAHGGAGADALFGQDGNDVLTGEDGDDQITGGDGTDDVAGGAGNDILTGSLGFGTGDDAAADTINGQDGDDVVYLGAGDVGAGQSGADTFVLQDIPAGQPPAVITDFTAGEDSLVLLYDAAVHPAPVVTFESDTETGHATVLLDGVPLATVLGAAGLDPSQIEIRAA